MFRFNFSLFTVLANWSWTSCFVHITGNSTCSSLYVPTL